MDSAYISMVSTWLEAPINDTDYIRLAHQKVLEYLKCQKDQKADLSEFSSEFRRVAPAGVYLTRAGH